jgi:hypothetical protein
MAWRTWRSTLASPSSPLSSATTTSSATSPSERPWKGAHGVVSPPTVRAPLDRWSGGAESGVAGSDDGLGAVGDLEFGEDVRDVVADGFRAEVQPAGDVGVAAALGEQRQHFAVAFGQYGERHPLPRRGAPAALVCDPWGTRGERGTTRSLPWSGAGRLRRHVPRLGSFAPSEAGDLQDPRSHV